MVEVTRRAALALTAGAATPIDPVAPGAAKPTSPVAAVLAQHPWINQPKYIETTALAGKLAEFLGWPSSAGRALVRAAYEKMLQEPCGDEAFLADLDARVSLVMTSGAPLPCDRIDTPEAEARFRHMVVEIERRLNKSDPG